MNDANSALNLLKLDTINAQIRKFQDFKYFVKTSFAIAIRKAGVTGIDRETGQTKPFVYGKFIEDTCDFIQDNSWTMRVSARDHFKSVSLYAHFLWTLFKYRDVNLDNYYFSYLSGLASEHIGNIKKIAGEIPEFTDIIDLKPRAEGVIAYSWDNKHMVTLDPMGMLEFKRGLHPKGVTYADDILRDPTNKLDPLVIDKINNTFKIEMLSMPHGEFHVVGTAQTQRDFFFDDSLILQEGESYTENIKKFRRIIQPAIISRSKQEVIFPELRSWEWLESKRKTIGNKNFDQEYMVVPAYESDSYFEREEIERVIDKDLQNLDPDSNYELTNDVIAGYDLGKKGHPAHVSIFEVVEDDRRYYKQIYQVFWDKLDYIKQIERLTKLITAFKIDLVYFDATRGELDALIESGKVPDQLQPVVFSRKSKNAMATAFYQKVSRQEIGLIDDNRQTNQILAVNNNLDAIETSEGHGDSFWSIALALFEETKVINLT